MVLAILIILVFSGAVVAEERFEYDPAEKRDPFVSLITEGGGYMSDIYGISGIKDIRLEGIVWDEQGSSIAIINGEIVKEGQELGSVKVLKIEKDSVEFEINGEKVKVNLIEE